MKKEVYQSCLNKMANRRGILWGTQEYEDLKSHCEMQAQSLDEPPQPSQDSSPAPCGCQSEESECKMTVQEEIAHIIKTAKQKLKNETD